MKKIIRGLGLPILCLSLAPCCRADEVKGKVRFWVQTSYYSIFDEIRSNATNTYNFGNQANPRFVSDPRDDRASERSATISDGPALGAGAEVGVAKWKWGELVVEANYNYFQSEISNLEISGAFVLDNPTNPDAAPVLAFPDCITKFTKGIACFRTYSTDAGDIKWHNPQLSGKVRFRPSKAFSPYLGLGAGYYLVDYKRSSELDFFSTNIANSVGFEPRGTVIDNVPDIVIVFKQLGPIEVVAKDAFEWHALGGIEYTWKKRWTLYLDSRFLFSDGKVRITTDGLEEFGVSPFPVVVDHHGAPPGSGGLLDVGTAEAVQDPDHPSGWKLGPKDGLADGGQMFVQGGEIKYGGFIFAVGMRFTF